MALYILRRVLMLVPTLVGMSILIFFMLRLLPGDVVDIIAGSDSLADAASRERLREAFGLSDPIPVQYVKWVGGVLTGNPGVSFRSGKPVAGFCRPRRWSDRSVAAEFLDRDPDPARHVKGVWVGATHALCVAAR
jgi:peptide/nickel transport system permease protein